MILWVSEGISGVAAGLMSKTGRLQIQSWVHVCVSLVDDFMGVWGHQWCCCRFDEQDWQTTDTILSTCMCFACRWFYGCLTALVVLLQVWWAAQVAWQTKDAILSTCICFTCRRFYGCLRASLVLLQVWWLRGWGWESHRGCLQGGQRVPSFTPCWIWGPGHHSCNFPENSLWQVYKTS